MIPKIVGLDVKDGITLSHNLTRGVSGYTVTEMKDHKIMFEPHVEIPAREK